MKKMLIKTISLVILALSFSLYPLSGSAGETGMSPDHKTKAQQQSETKKHDILADKQKQIVEEAVQAYKATIKALKALDNNQSKQALAALRIASGNLDLLLTREPGLGLLPIDIQAQVIELKADLSTIKQLEDDLEDMVDDHHYFEARTLLNSLADEIRLTTVALPLAVYPDVIKESLKLIDAENTEEAKTALYTALNSLVITQEVIPLPVVRAESLLTQAFQVEHKADLSKKETRKKIESLVNQTEDELKIAESLGYGGKDNYKDLYQSIDALKEAIGTAGFIGKWNRMKEALSHFKNKLVHPAG